MSPLNSTASSQSAVWTYSRFFFQAVLVIGLVGIVLLNTVPLDVASSTRWMLAACHAALAGAALLALLADPRPVATQQAVLFGVAVLAVLTTGFDTGVLKAGLRSPVLGFCGLVVFSTGAILGTRHAVALALVAIVQSGVLAWAEARGLIGDPLAPTPLALALLVQILLAVCAGAAGAQIARILRRQERQTLEREQHIRALLSIAADWYWEQDRAFRFTHVSHASDTGGTRSLWDITDMGLSAEQLDAYRADLESHRPFNGLRARRRDDQGRWRTISLSGQPRFDITGTFIGYWGVARDVTHEVRAERAVVASETRYRELFARSPSPLFLHRRGVVFDGNDAAARLFGFQSAAAMNGFQIVGLFGGGNRDRVTQRLARLDQMSVGEGLDVGDFQIRSLDGRTLTVQATAVRVDTSSGPANLSILFDITARKAAEAALRRSEALLSHLFATSPDCITLTEMETGRYAMVNPAFCRLTEFSAEEVLGKTSLDIKLWRDLEDRSRLVAGVAATGTVTDMPATINTKSGGVVSMLVSAGRFVMDERDYLVINARDVTQTERTRLQHTAILERASIGIAFTRERRFVQTNPFFERMFGWEPGTLLGQSGRVVWADEADYEEIGRLASPLLSVGLPFEVERRMRRLDGSEFWCRMLAQAIDRDAPGPGGTIWITEDVTERKRLDEALAAARDAAEAASQAKSAFLANTSHEIRTPLNGLLGLARLATLPHLTDARRQQYLEQVLDCAQSLADIMSDILDVSKIEAGKFTLDDAPFDLRQALQAVHHAYASLAEVKGLALELSIAPTVPPIVRGDPVRVRQILSNFITNALKFTDRGQVRIEATLAASGAVRLTVSDTGPGIAGSIQQRLFQPFMQGDSSTTRRYGGTGLGLSICRELAQLMGGSVGVDSAPGAGSTFWAELPLPASVLAVSEPAAEASDLSRLRGLRVLMAEDNPVNMMIGVAMLEHWGVQVEQAVDGCAAVQAVQAANDAERPFDAVLMDVQMPVMSGHEAARELRRRDPSGELPIIALTAAALVSERDEALRAGMDDFLTKPIDAAKLRRTLVRLARPARNFSG